MHVFISYKSEEKDLAIEVHKQLYSQAFVSWYDWELKAGDEWRQVIDEAIRDSMAVVVIVTPLSMKSSYVTYEWSFALGLGKRVIPIVYKMVRGKKSIHPRLDPKQFIDFTQSNKDWNKLFVALREVEKVNVVPQSIAEAGAILQSIKSKDLWDEALVILERSSHPSCIEILLAAIEGHIDEISALAALAFSRKTGFKDQRAIIGLKRALENETLQQDKKYGLPSGEALGMMGSNDAVDILVKMYPKLGIRTPLAIAIPRYLGLSYSNTNAKPFLRELLDLQINLDHYTVGADVLASVIQSLGELKDEGALSRIRQIAKTSVGSDRLDMRRNAIRAWISIGGDHELPEIKRDLDDMRHSQATYVSTTYVDSVASLRTSAAVNLLKEFIQENPKTWLTPEIKAALERNNLS